MQSSTVVSSPSHSKRRSSVTGTNLSAIERAASANERAAIRKAMRDIEFVSVSSVCDVSVYSIYASSALNNVMRFSDA